MQKGISLFFPLEIGFVDSAVLNGSLSYEL